VLSLSSTIVKPNGSCKIGLLTPLSSLPFAALPEMEFFMREEVIHAVETHLNGLGTRDISASPFHHDIEFVGPIGPPLKGAATVRAVFTGFFPTIKGIRIIRHIVDGEWCATVFDFDTTFGIIPMIDCFHVVAGQILSIRVYYDPRPILEGMSRAAPSPSS